MNTPQVEGNMTVLWLLNIFVTMRNETTGDFLEFLNTHIEWLSALELASYDSDEKLYSPIIKHLVRALRDFLKHPEEHLEAFNMVFDEYYSVKLSCRRFSNIEDDNYHSMDEYFTTIVADLDYILANTDYKTMKEDNRIFYQELNKHVLNPKRIQKMAGQFDIDFCEYVDAICD